MSYFTVTTPRVQGIDVLILQHALLDLGYTLPGYGADGIYGDETDRAKKAYMKTKGLLLTPESVKGRVELIEWAAVHPLIPRGAHYDLIDVRTGVTWEEQRRGGSNHIDSEPVTADDTAKMKSVYNGKWAWTRRPVWVVFKDRVFAASINGMPHGYETIAKENGFDGHHCIHFLHSRTHGTNKQCPLHQAAVQEAYTKGK